MKKYIFGTLLICNLSLCMEIPSSAVQIMHKRLDTLFAKLQQPVDKDFEGTTHNYRGTLLKQVESLLSDSHTAGYTLPIDAQTKCHGDTFLCRAAEHNLPFLSTILSYTAAKLNLAKAFWIAASRGKGEAVDALLIFDPMLTWQDGGYYIGTALHKAAYGGHKQVVQQIIDYCFAHAQKNDLNVKAILEARDIGDQTPFEYASEKKDHEIMALIKAAVDRSKNPTN